MLSKSASELMKSLYHAINNTTYVIYAWSDIENMIKDENKDTYKDLFEEIRLNQCLVLKYKDENQVCFAMTDKAKLLTQELDAMEDRTKIKETMIKTDEQGNSMLVIPTTNVKELEDGMKVQSLGKVINKNRIKNFIYGFIGGFIGGLVAFGISYVIMLLIK